MVDLTKYLNDPLAMHELMNMLHRGPETPEEWELFQCFLESMAEFDRKWDHLPAEWITPDMRETYRWCRYNQANFPKIAEQVRRGHKPPEMLKREARMHNESIDRVLAAHPSLNAMQHEIDSLLRGMQHTKRFNLPALLNSIAKHHNRKQHFVLMNSVSPTDKDISDRLEELRNNKPKIHPQLIDILVQASLMEKFIHAKDCTCLLCTHMKSSLASTSTASGSSIQH